MVAEVDSLKAATKSVLRDIAKHANGLAVGLQNAAPPQDKPAKTVLYLTEIAAYLEEVSRAVNSQQTESDKE